MVSDEWIRKMQLADDDFKAIRVKVLPGNKSIGKVPRQKHIGLSRESLIYEDGCVRRVQ